MRNERRAEAANTIMRKKRRVTELEMMRKKRRVTEFEIMRKKRRVTEFEEGWKVVQAAFTKLKDVLEGDADPKFNAEECSLLYTTIYNMCFQKPQRVKKQQLYDGYTTGLTEYLNTTVLRALKGKQNKCMLKELVKRWKNNKIMVQWLSRFFSALDRYISNMGLPALREVGLFCFGYQVYAGMKNDVKDAVIVLIDGDKESAQIDRPLLQDVVRIFLEIGTGIGSFGGFGLGRVGERCLRDFEPGKMRGEYFGDFELGAVTLMAEHYERKAISKIEEDHFLNFLLKAKECLEKRKERAQLLLPGIGKDKLLEDLLL